ncbi:unnamed protein product [Discula destructiva]
MLGWALNKAAGNASSNAPPTPGPDDTFVEQPDTPAPVFAARAFKRALFGTPAPPPKETLQKEIKTAAAKLDKNTAKPRINLPEPNTFDSPSKPQGILLTPGTAAARRKRVSFGRDVKATNPTLTETSNGANRARPKTKLQEALENSRKRRSIRSSSDDDARTLDFDPEVNNEDADDLWEEVDEFDRDAEGTLDLNEPRSQSGRYWKGEFQKYHKEAQAEMEKLVKYKQLAKSYAKAKDAEAMDLSQRLKEEQAKAVDMERRITELAGQISGKHGRTGGQDEKELLRDLTRQTALAVQYRKQVDELEACLKDSGYEADGSKRRRGAQPTDREQARDLNDLRLELQRAKSELTVLQEREKKAETEKRELERRLSRKDAQYDSLTAELDALRDKNWALREEVSSLRRASQSDDAGRLREDLQVMSTSASAPNTWSRKHDDPDTRLDEEQVIRSRGIENARDTNNTLQQDFKRTAGLKSPALRKSSADLRARLGQTPKLDDDTQDLLQHRPIPSVRRTATRPINRGNKRIVSSRTDEKKPESTGLASTTRATPRRSDTPKTIELARLSRKSRLGLVTERALDSESDPEPKLNSVPSNRSVPARSSLTAERRAAVIARLEQKRAERKKSYGRSSTPGKENLRP